MLINVFRVRGKVGVSFISVFTNHAYACVGADEIYPGFYFADCDYAYAHVRVAHGFCYAFVDVETSYADYCHFYRASDASAEHRD